MTFKHLHPMTKTPGIAQLSNFAIKLDATTQIIDRLLLVPRQSPWKIGPIEPTDTTDTGTDTTNPGNIEI